MGTCGRYAMHVLDQIRRRADTNRTNERAECTTDGYGDSRCNDMEKRVIFGQQTSARRVALRSARVWSPGVCVERGVMHDYGTGGECIWRRAECVLEAMLVPAAASVCNRNRAPVPF